MANTINLASKYLPLLDAKYKKEAVTSILDAPDDLVRETMQAKTVLLPKMTLQGLGDYSRGTGFVNGDATLEWQSHTFTQDRGRSFQIDDMDNEETLGVAFGRLSGEFLRLHVAPEVDAYRLASYATAANTTVNADLAPTTAMQAFDTAMAQMDEDEVPMEGRIVFVSPTMYKFIKQSDLVTRFFQTNGQNQINRNVIQLEDVTIVRVPQSRFQTGFTFYDGTTGGQEAGGFVEKIGEYKINFMILHPSAVLQIAKHAKLRIFEPDVNQDADAYKFDYRIYHDAFVPDNKTTGIYVHTVATANA